MGYIIISFLEYGPIYPFSQHLSYRQMYQPPRHRKRFCRHLPPEILSSIISFCHVSSLPALCAVSGGCHTMVTGVLKSRMGAALMVYLPQSSHERFWNILENMKSIILGAVPLLVFLPSVTPICLDIALPAAALDEWITFFQEIDYCKAFTCALNSCQDIKSTVTLIKRLENTL